MAPVEVTAVAGVAAFVVLGVVATEEDEAFLAEFFDVVVVVAFLAAEAFNFFIVVEMLVLVLAIGICVGVVGVCGLDFTAAEDN